MQMRLDPLFGRFFRDADLFSKNFKCYSLKYLNKPEDQIDSINSGGKIILPPSTLEQLISNDMSTPMTFSICNVENQKTTSCGVLEFVADEGCVYVPDWMIATLGLQEGRVVNIEVAYFEKGTFIRFQPTSEDFLNITDPKAVLENSLRNFVALTCGDIISILYNETTYNLLVLETKPENTISVYNIDIEVDFAPPLDMSNHATGTSRWYLW